jgi:hypothetical protein
MLRVTRAITPATTQLVQHQRRILLSRSLTSNVNNQGTTTIYEGPLAKVAKRLKLFSITSLGLGTGISPFVFAIDVPVPFVAKAALVGVGK